MRKAAVIAVADSHGELIAFAAWTGSTLLHPHRCQQGLDGGARAQADPGHRRQGSAPRKGHDIAYYGDPKFVGWGGGIPVWREAR